MGVRKTAETRKSEIVEAALRLAAELGPERLTTHAIADAVGITQPAIFRHFPSKDDLWEAVAARVGETMEARWTEAEAGVAVPTQRVHALVNAQLRLIDSTPAIPAILFSRELHARNERLRSAFFRLLRRFHTAIADHAAKAIAAGELRGELDPDDVAILVVALVQGLAVRWSVSGRNFDLVAEGGRLLDVQLSGLAAAKAGNRGVAS